MSKYYGAACVGVGSDCFDNALSWCERLGNGCTGGSMGDVGIEEAFNKLSKSDFQLHMQASTTKFLLDRNGAFVEVGLFADAGLQPGDKLIAIIEDVKAGAAYTMKYDAEKLLTWQFTAENLIIAFKRNGEGMSETMKNPAFEVTL